MKKINRKNKGFTLIELLAVIVILAIIAIIATPLILNIINRVRREAFGRSAEGVLKAGKNYYVSKQLEPQEFEPITFHCEAGMCISEETDGNGNNIELEVEGNVGTGDITINQDGTIVLKLTNNSYCAYKTIDSNGIEVEKGECDDVKYKGSVKLSSSNGNYQYPTSGTFEVIENLSGGQLSCSSDDTDVATCSIDGTTVTVVPGTKKGYATLTITSRGTSKYKEAQASYVASTTNGPISYTANDMEFVYDGLAHGISISIENAVVKYGTVEGVYDLEQNPTYVDAGVYTTYFEITRAGYETMTSSRQVKINKANGEVILESTKGNIPYNSTVNIDITSNKSEQPMTVQSSSDLIVTGEIVNDKLSITGVSLGDAILTVTSSSSKNYKEATAEYEATVVKANNTLKLSSTTGLVTLTYPDSVTYVVEENLSGGNITCLSNNTSAVTCTVGTNGSGQTTITISSGVDAIEGVEVTVTSAETTNYKEGTKVYYVTSQTGDMLSSITATEYNQPYDGNRHGITVSSSISGAEIRYGTSDCETNICALPDSPKYTNVGTYTVYYQITASGYATIRGSRDVVISKATGSIKTLPSAKTLTYTGASQELVTAGASDTGIVKYRLGDTGEYSTTIPSATNAGTYNVYYIVEGDGNHTSLIDNEPITVTISKANIYYTHQDYNGVYDGQPHSIELITEATITYKDTDGNYTLSTKPTYIDVGTYTVYYKLTREGYNDVENSNTVTITQANNTLKLSSTTGLVTLTYPDSVTYVVEENLSGGDITCSSNNTSAVTCTVGTNGSGETTITIASGVDAISGVEVTVTSAETKNYKAGTAVYYVTSQNGNMLPSITAAGYNEPYDGNEHGITVSSSISGSEVRYGTSDCETNACALTDSPKYTNVGTYKVYYQVTASGYATIRGSKDVIISKANGSINAPTAKTLTYTGLSQELVTTGTSDTGTVKYRLGDTGEYSTTIPSAINAGTYKVYYMVVGDSNHNNLYDDNSAYVNVEINKADGSIKTLPQPRSLAYTGNNLSLVTGGASDTGTFEYKLEGGTYSTDIPTGKNYGTYRVYYRVIGDSNHNNVEEAYVDVTIAKANNTLELSSETALVTLTYPDSVTYVVEENPSGGDITCSSSNTSAVTCSVGTNGSGKKTITIASGTDAIENVEVVVTSAETANYNAGRATYYVTSQNGNMLPSITATGYNEAYDGNEHGITVSSSISGAEIKYGTSNCETNTCTLTASPKYTNVGTNTVYYQVTAPGYTTIRGSRDVVISKAGGSIKTTPSAKTLAYTGLSQELVTTGTSDTGTVKYRLGDTGEYSTTIPSATNAGTYKVYYMVAGDNNHNDFNEGDFVTVTIAKASGGIKTTPSAKTLTYTGEDQQLVTAGASDTGTVKYRLGDTGEYSTTIPSATNVGTYKVYYMVTGDSNHNDVAGNYVTVTIAKANNVLTMSSTTANVALAYPNSVTYVVEANPSGGNITCSSNNTSAVTCTVGTNGDGKKTITMTAGTSAVENVTVTVNSAATDNYNIGQVIYYVTSALGSLPSATVTGVYNGPCDGTEKYIKVSSSVNGATVKYGTVEGTYNLDESPKYTAPGTYPIYYKITAPGYEPMTGSRTITITTPTASQIQYDNTLTGITCSGETEYTSLKCALDTLYDIYY